MSKRSVARGALLGAFVGDASGATLEFLGRKPRGEDVERALSMVGGGCWRVAPGQITDDGELALCLARSLAGAPSIDWDKIARAYVDWFNSRPFDCGNTTRNAFGHGWSRDRATAHLVEEVAQRSNMASKANGALMRSIGLGIWSWRLSAEEAAEAARNDARLSHPNPSCLHANAAYRRRAASRPECWRQPRRVPGGECNPRRRGRGRSAKLAPRCGSRLGAALSSECRVRPYRVYPCVPASQSRDAVCRGVARDAQGGGDTDTNACIVGELLGALHGEDDIPQPMRAAVLTCDTARGRPRPEFFSTQDAASLADQLTQ